MTIEVEYEVASTDWKRRRLLKKLENIPLLSFDTETKGMYSKEERKQAKQLLDKGVTNPKVRAEYSLIVNNSGLSFPSLVNTTHFIFGVSKSFSYILIASSYEEEMVIWNWVKNYNGHLRIWNALFDLKIMYNRVNAFPKSYTDGMLLAKCLINNADNYKALVGLKELMGSHYKPSWSLYDAYEPENLRDLDFLEYCAIDGAAVMLFFEQAQVHLDSTVQ